MRLLKLKLLILAPFLAVLTGVSQGLAPVRLSLATPVWAQTVNNGPTDANALLQQCRKALASKQVRDAMQLCQQAQAAYQQLGDRSGEAKATTNLGIAHLRSGQWPSALDILQGAVGLAQESQERRVEAIALQQLGITYQLLGDPQQANDALQQALAIAQELNDTQLESSTAGLIASLENRSQPAALKAAQFFLQGTLHIQANQHQAAIEPLENARALFRDSNNLEGEALASSFLGMAYTTLGQHQQATETAQEALEVVAQAIPLSKAPGRLKIAEMLSLFALGASFNALDQHPSAIDALQKALFLISELDHTTGQTEDLNNLSDSLRNLEPSLLFLLAQAHSALGQTQKAIEATQKALPLFQDLGDREREWLALLSLGQAYVELNQYQQAMPILQQLLTLSREINNSFLEAASLMSLGSVHISLSQWEQGIEIFKQSLQLSKQADFLMAFEIFLQSLKITKQQSLQLSKQVDLIAQIKQLNPLLEATSLAGLGATYTGLSQYQQAIDFLGQSLSIFRQLDYDSGQAAALAFLGWIHRNLGQYEQSLQFYQQSLDLFREAKDSGGEAGVLGHLGLLYPNLGERQQAIDVLQQSLSIFPAGDQSTAVFGLGEVYRELGQYQQAIDAYQQALVTAREEGDRYTETITLDRLGLAYQALGQTQLALEAFQQSLVIAREIDSPIEAGQALSDLGMLLAEQSQPELGIVFLKESVNVRESIRDNLKALPREQQLSFVTTVSDSYRRLADLLLQQDRILEAQQVLDLLKVQELDDYIRGVRGTNVKLDFTKPEADILAKYNELQTSAIELGQELTALRKIPAGQRTPAQADRLAQLVKLEIDLNQAFRQFIRSAEVQQLTAQLSASVNDPVLSLQSLNRLRDDLGKLDAVLLYPLILDDRLELVITTPNAPPLRRTVPITRAQLTAAISTFRQTIQDPTANPKPLAQQLYQWLIAPIEADLEQAQAKTIIYAPDRALRYIPLAALHNGEQWLVETYGVNNITAESLTDFTRQPTANPSLLAGAFATGNHRIQVGDRQFDFDGLPAAGKEVNLLTQLLAGVKLVDRDFSLEATLTQMNEHDIVHLATHAQFLPGTPQDSFIVFGNGEKATLAEIGNWTLTNVDLVVLSACETGLGGKFGNGEEVLGLGYQFQTSGARAALASLWQVSDGGTQVLMNAFYDVLKAEQTTKADALRQAQIALIQSQSRVSDNPRAGLVAQQRNQLRPEVGARLDHPYYWAPFILIGNGL